MLPAPAFLPSLEPETQAREKVWRRVRAVSIGQHGVGRERFKGRKAAVLRWLSYWRNLQKPAPTSGELAQWTWPLSPGVDWTGHLLYVRRGLSDLQKTANVESVPEGQRHCRVTGSLCETWRPTLAGRNKRQPATPE